MTTINVPGPVVVAPGPGGQALGYALAALAWFFLGFFFHGGWIFMEWLIAKLN